MRGVLRRGLVILVAIRAPVAAWAMVSIEGHYREKRQKLKVKKAKVQVKG